MPTLPGDCGPWSTASCSSSPLTDWPTRVRALQPVALVQGPYLRLLDVEQAQQWNSRGHFFSAAAEAMRRILIDNARRKQRPKHGGDRVRVNLDGLEVGAPETSDDLLAL